MDEMTRVHLTLQMVVRASSDLNNLVKPELKKPQMPEAPPAKKLFDDSPAQPATTATVASSSANSK